MKTIIFLLLTCSAFAQPGGAPFGFMKSSSTLNDGIIAYWKLDEASGTRSDSKGSNHLTDTNTVTAAAGVISNAAEFVAPTKEYLQIADNAALSVGDQDFTFCAWVKLTTKTDYRTILGKSKYSAAAPYEYWMDYDFGVNRFRFFASDGTNYGFAIANNLGIPSTGTWYFVVGWHDAAANTVNISVNDGTVNSVSYTFGSHDGQSAFRIGGTGAVSNMDGLIDEVGFWKRVLTASERTQLYNAGAGRTYPF